MFSRLKVPGYKLNCIEWVRPLPDESLSHYAERLAPKVDQSEPPILLGVSFGGVMALELARHVRPALTILISSIRRPTQLPWYFRLPGRLRLHRLLPLNTSRFSEFNVRFLNGVRDEADIRLLRTMLYDADRHFIRWAIDRLVLWKGCPPVGKVVHIHGTSDRMLPIRYVSPDVRIAGGSHLMIVTRAEETGGIISDVLKQNSLP
jgi:pimeloyl-ACP methyl ester carboxylesterase